MLIYKLFL